MSRAPSDAMADAAWDQIMAIARRHALVVEAYGGVATLATPDEQRKAGLRHGVLRTHLMDECENVGRSAEVPTPKAEAQASLLDEAGA